MSAYVADPSLPDDPKDFGPDGYQYGFTSDMTTGVIAYVFGSIPFKDQESAEHTCRKSYMYDYAIVRRKPGKDWEEVYSHAYDGPRNW